MKIAVLFALAAALAPAATAPAFAPLESWKNAVFAGNQVNLTSLYTTDPRRTLLVGKQPITLEDETKFWASLHSAGLFSLNPKVLSFEQKPGQAQLVLRIQGQMADKRRFVVAMTQIWINQFGTWLIAASQRSDLGLDAGRRLTEPSTPNPNLYPPPAEAQAELESAERRAANEHKHILVVFGANWCYDCHVLDATLRSPQFASLVSMNYVLVHINTGDEGKDNTDLAARLGVSLDKGIPSLAVLLPNGKVLVAQQNGEFESTVKIGPEDVRAFLQKWKPLTR
jgi:thioredoxin 1